MGYKAETGSEGVINTPQVPSQAYVCQTAYCAIGGVGVKLAAVQSWDAFFTDGLAWQSCKEAEYPKMTTMLHN